MRNNRYIKTVLKQFEKEFGHNKINTKKSWNWFREYIRKNLNSMRTSQVMIGNPQIKSFPMHGEFYFYVYDAKYKSTLPYWDSFPLTLILDVSESHFLGINFHYLSPKHRMWLFSELSELKNNSRYNKNTRIIATYQRMKMLSKFPLVQHSIKRYLFKQTRSKFITVDPKVWGLCIQLPVERFHNSSNKNVWTDAFS
jgi:hypothetical protein